jgi:branched-chain amino acid aminotransferase
MATLVNLDGALVPPAAAAVSIFDRGFLYGDSVYEVIRTYGGRPFELEAHLDRLEGSAARIGLAMRWGRARIAEELRRTLAASLEAGGDEPPDPAAAPWNAGERSLRIVMTRGSGELGLDPALATDPRAIVIARPLSAPPLESYRRGVAAIVAGMRHVSPQAMDPGAKTGNHLHAVLAVREARAAGAHEALLLDGAGFVTEGATSNVLRVKDGRVETPPVDAGILAGVTRALVLALARGAGLPVMEVRLSPADLAAADELFITSTAREVLPVTVLDGRSIRGGVPGPVTRRLHALFRERADGVARG